MERWNGAPPYIAISGMIGAGKTTLARALGQALNLPVYEEPVVDSVYLADFYREPEEYGFRLQIFLLQRRFRQQQQVLWTGTGGGGVQDRSIYEDQVFARMLHDQGLMETRDLATYEALFRDLSVFMPHPHLLIHLDCSPEESLRRVRERSRSCEVGVTLEYLQALHAGYERFLAEVGVRVPVLRVPWEQFRTTEQVVDMVRREWREMTRPRQVDWNR